MATIPRRGPFHVRKTIAFDGSAGAGEWGTNIPVFTTTGAVLMLYYTIRCTETLMDDGSDLSLQTNESAGGQRICHVRSDAVAGEFGAGGDYSDVARQLPVFAFPALGNDGPVGPLPIVDDIYLECDEAD